MNSGLLVVERMIVETLVSAPKTLQMITNETELSRGLVLNLLQGLILKNLINYERGSYSLNRNEWLNKECEFNSNDNLKVEMKELFTSLVNRYFQKESSTQLRYKKISLNEEEEKTFHQMLRNLDLFMENVEKRRIERGIKVPPKDRHVVIWGHSAYAGVVNDIINAV